MLHAALRVDATRAEAKRARRGWPGGVFFFFFPGENSHLWRLGQKQRVRFLLFTFRKRGVNFSGFSRCCGDFGSTSVGFSRCFLDVLWCFPVGFKEVPSFQKNRFELRHRLRASLLHLSPGAK